MAISGDISLAQNGDQGNAKFHPYLVTLVRWCVSSLWSTATVFLHRLLITPLQPITGAKLPALRPRAPKRAAGTEHLHPEPRVECQLLHQPDNHTMDVIFVHGLYGSLGNTWRQGEWRQKYIEYPQKVPLRNHTSSNACKCRKNSYNNQIYTENKSSDCNMTDLNDPEMSFTKINEKLSKKVIPEENYLITEQFYNNSLMDQDLVHNYDTQAKFVSDLFKKENDSESNEKNKYKHKENGFDRQNNMNQDDDDLKRQEINEFNECKCSLRPEKKCEVGCGCICNECYSNCWPKDWIKEDFPGARVISINYTSDPYLWRPLWIKENKRLNLYQRAEQMIEQLLEMGVGRKPIIWVGHSKGGLFIKQIYCEAYEAYMKINKYSMTKEEKPENTKKIPDTSNESCNGITAENIDTIIGHFTRSNEETENLNDDENSEVNCYTENNDNYTNNDDNRENNENYTNNDDNRENNDNSRRINEEYRENNDNSREINEKYRENNEKYRENNDNSREINENYTENNNNSREINENYRENNENSTEINENYREKNDDTRGINKNKKEQNNHCKRNNENMANNNSCVIDETVANNNVFEQINDDNLDVNGINDNLYNLRHENGNGEFENNNGNDLENQNWNESITSNVDEAVSRRAALWRSSRGFMFYSVPHRGSPLADIKTPVTARSVDLLEIAKDCQLVSELQARWVEAARGGASSGGASSGGASSGGASNGWASSGGASRGGAVVRGVVESRRTLMSVLWLRIVSADSADAGIGTLSSVSVDHREICKPSSRSCILYTELTDLIRDALACRCQ